MWYLFCCFVNIWSKLFFVLKYVAWCFYMWYTELVCLFEYWVCILCLLYFTGLVVDIVVFAVLVIPVHLGILCIATWKEYWKCKRIFLWTSLLFMIFLLCTSLLYEFYFVLLTESVCLCCLTEFCIFIIALCALYSSCAFDIEKFKLDICYCVDWDYIPICATELQKGYLFCLCLCHEGLFYFVTFLSQNFLFLFSGGESVAVRSFWAFWKMGCLGFCRNSVLSKSWTILFCHKSIFWDWQFFSEFWLWLLFIL